MFCMKCGAELNDGAKFCNKCGAPVESKPAAQDVEAEEKTEAAEEPVAEELSEKPTEAAEEPAAEELSEKPTETTEEPVAEEPAEKPAETVAEPVVETTQNVDSEVTTQPDIAVSTANVSTPSTETSGTAVAVKAPAKAKKSKLVPIIIISASAVVLVGILVAVLALVLSNRKVQIDVTEYIEFKFDGYSTLGTAEVKFNKSAFGDKYDKKLHYTKEGKEVFGNKDEYKAFIGLVEQAVPGGIYATSLANGDEITFKWDESVTSRIEEYFKVELECQDVTVTVEGLDVAPEVDIFSDITITVEGVAPNGLLSIEGTNDYDLYYVASTTDGLSNGDVVTITAYPSYSDENLRDYMMENYQLLPKETEMTYTVEGLPAYVASADDIPVDLMKQMQEQADSVAQAELVTNDGEEETVVGTTCVGYFFLTTKNPGDDWNSHNSIIFVYKSVVHVHYENDGKVFDQDNVYYNWCTFKDIMILSDGTASVDLGKYDTCNSTTLKVDSGIDNGWFSTKSWVYKGYDSITSLKDNLITKIIDKYNYADYINYDLVGDTTSPDTTSETTAETSAESTETTDSSESATDTEASDTETSETTTEPSET